MMGIVSESGAWNLRVLRGHCFLHPDMPSLSSTSKAPARAGEAEDFPLEVPLGTRGVGSLRMRKHDAKRHWRLG